MPREINETNYNLQSSYSVDHKSSKDLQEYLGHIAEQASMANGASDLPSVIILDNLHHASALGDVFSCLLSAGPASKLPCIIGTMSQATCNTTNLQLHHNFRWVSVYLFTFDFNG